MSATVTPGWMSATITPGWTALCQEAGFAKRDNHVAQRSVSSPSRLKTQGCSFGASGVTQDVSSTTKWGEDPSQTRTGERTLGSPERNLEFLCRWNWPRALASWFLTCPVSQLLESESGCGMEKGKWVGEARPTDLESGGRLS